MVLWRHTRPSGTNTPKRCPLHQNRLECKSRNSRDTGSNRQAWPWSTKWSGQRLTVLCQENTLIRANTVFQQHKRWLYTWTLPDGQYWNQTDYSLCSQRWRSSIQSARTRMGADCGSDHELLIAKFKLKLKKVGKNTRPLICDLNQIPYDYIVDMTNRFKGLDLRQSGWRTMDRSSWHCTGDSDQDHPQEKEMQKGKMVVWVAEKRSERQRRKGKISPSECRISKNSKER